MRLFDSTPLLKTELYYASNPIYKWTAQHFVFEPDNIFQDILDDSAISTISYYEISRLLILKM
jgi:hypothetical protein